MFPLRDENPSRGTPFVTLALIALNVLAYLHQNQMGLDVSAITYGLIPAELLQGADTVYGTRDGSIKVQNLDPSYLTLFTSMFMHGNLLHIAGNMWYLWLFGNNVEDSMGHGKYLFFYLASGLAADAAQLVLDASSTIPMVGASGAVAGVLGAYLFLFPGSRVLCLITTFVIQVIEVPAFIVLGIWFLIQFISGIGVLGMQGQKGGVAYAAHVGGFVFGWLVAHFFHRREMHRAARERQSSGSGWQ